MDVVRQAITSLKPVVSSAGFLSLALHGVGLGTRLLFMVAILQLSGTKLLGEYGLLMSIELVVIYLAGFEFHSFTTRRYARRPNLLSLRLALASHGRMLVFSGPLAVAAASIATWALGLHLSNLELLMFLIIILSGSLVQEANRFIVMTKNPVYAIATAFVRTAAWQPLAVIFVGHPDALEWILACWSIAATLSAIWAIWLLRSAIYLQTNVRIQYLAKGLIASRGYYVIAVTTVLQGNLERFVLQSFLGPEAVGLFAFFQTLANTLSGLAQSAVLNVALPSLLTGFGKKQVNRFIYLDKVRSRTLWIGIALGISIIVASAALFKLTDQTEHFASVWMLFALVVGQVILLSTLPIQIAIYAGHHDKILMWMSLSTLLTALFVSIVMVSLIGISGAVASQLIGSIIVSLARRGLFARLKRSGQL